MSWLDAEVGGLPRRGISVATGDAGVGKSTFALGYTISALRRGRACFVTTDSPASVIEAASATFEEDLRAKIASSDLTVLNFGLFFVNKMRSLQSVARPLAELTELVAEREIDHVVFDTLDPLLGWIEAPDAKSVASGIVQQMRSWNVSILATASAGGGPGLAAFLRLADGCFEMERDLFIVRSAKWCNVSDVETPVRLVQGRGLTSEVPAASWAPRATSLVPSAPPPSAGTTPLLKLVARESGAPPSYSERVARDGRLLAVPFPTRDEDDDEEEDQNTQDGRRRIDTPYEPS